MSCFHRIVAAVDFSEPSDAALRRAIAIARDAHAALHLVHAYEIPSAATPHYGMEIATELLDAVRDAGARRLEKERAAAHANGVVCEAHLRAGPPASAIVEAAAELRADLIVMGTRGLGGLKHVLLGSTAERTVRTAPCPVLTMKAGAPSDGRFASILVPVDFSEHTEAVLAMAIELAKESHGRIHLLHVYELPTMFATAYGVPIPPSVWTDIQAAADAQITALGDLVKRAGIPFTQQLATAPVSDAIVEAASAQHADLIVMGTRGHGGLEHFLMGSVAERTLRHASCPVLTLRGAAG